VVSHWVRLSEGDQKESKRRASPRGSMICISDPPMAAWSIEREGKRIRIVGALRMAHAREIWRALHAAARDARESLDLDVSSVTEGDSTTIAMVVEFRNAFVERGIRSEIVGTPDALLPLVQLYRGDVPVPSRRDVRPPPARMARFGSIGKRVLVRIRGPVGFLGELVDALSHTLRQRRKGTLRAVGNFVERTGADAVLIVLLLDFLVGFVIAFQTMPQLASYGADLYVADIVGISVTRELVPLMTAVILSGRSGAAFAAELGTMRVNEEIDALRTMGISPSAYLVLPRVVALVIAAPVLTLLGDVVAVAGGWLVAVSSLGLTSRSYLSELQLALEPADVWTGLAKSVAFGATIALIGCHQGLSTTGSAAGVGRRTTSTVVLCLFTIVVLDTVLTIVFRAGGA
jgi:phospholipid/cholesterol/gamma-HCH transport system permease protein